MKIHAAVLGCAALSLATAASGQPVQRPSFESALPAGSVVAARWELPADASATPMVLAQVRQGTDHRCVAGALVANRWVLQSVDQLPDEANPILCLSAARVANRWVIARWSLGGSGEGRNRQNESSLELLALVNNQLRPVWSGAVNTFALLPSGPFLSLASLSPGREVLVWSADNSRLVPQARNTPTPRR
ncbi:MAG: hypothetical protein JNK72_19935 [Myxococcales bacterium]|nr:hypothetical protein [Myxococcales bacterium]